MLPFTNTQLLRIAGIGGLAIGFGGLFFRSLIQSDLKKSGCCVESLRILRSHEGIAQYMGAPIRDGKIDIGDRKNNYNTGKEAKFQIPVKGSKEKGVFYIWASREEFSDPWSIDRLELGIKGVEGKRILVLDKHKNDNN